MVEIVAIVFESSKLDDAGLIKELVHLAETLLAAIEEGTDQRAGWEIFRIGHPQKRFEHGTEGGCGLALQLRITRAHKLGD